MLTKVSNTVWFEVLQHKCVAILKYMPVLAVIVWVLLSNISDGNFQQLLNSVLYSLLGVAGAVFANLSGAGGGIVFIPVFSHLGLADEQALSTSFSIQCFGMTSGAIVWSRYYLKSVKHDIQWSSFIPSITITAPFSVLGLWTAQSHIVTAPANLLTIFGIFSVVLGAALIAQYFWSKNISQGRSQLSRVDKAGLVVIGYGGGLITAWLSIGVGELLVFFLIIRGFNVSMAIASAVVVTAITVWAASIEHIWLNSHTIWQVAMYAGPGAVIGGIIAKKLAMMLPTDGLKLFLAIWILIMGLLA